MNCMKQELFSVFFRLYEIKNASLVNPEWTNVSLELNYSINHPLVVSVLEESTFQTLGCNSYSLLVSPFLSFPLFKY